MNTVYYQIKTRTGIRVELKEFANYSDAYKFASELKALNIVIRDTWGRWIRVNSPVY